MKEWEKKELIRYRLDQAGNALNDAKGLLEGEGSVEGVVNRSYYAMFYAVLALLQDVEKAPRKHSGAISLFDQEYFKKGVFPKELSKDLHKAFELRQRSDYQDMVRIRREAGAELFRKARNFVQAVQNYLKPHSNQEEERREI